MFTRCSTCASMSATISVLPPLHRESDIAEEDDRVGEKQAPEVALREGPIAPDDLPGVDLEDVPIEPGFRGWLDLAGAVMVNSICYGMTNSFGVFQEYYSTNQLSTSSATAISWIGSIQLCLCPLLGCASGPLFDAGYLRPLIGTGGALYVFCLMMTSIATEYYQFLLAHGIGVGLGMGIMFSPSVFTLAHHFGRSKWRTLAYGCQAAGSALGGIVFPVSLRYLFPTVGFAWGVRTMAFIVMLLATCSFFCLSTTHPPRKKLAILSPTVFRNTAYTVYVAGISCGSLAIYVPLTFGVTYASSHGFDSGLAFYSLAISNGCSIFGRIAPLIVAQRVGPINVLALFATISAIMLFSWTRARSIPGILIFDALYGVSSGAYAAAVNPSATCFAPHPNQAGLYLGMAFFISAFFWLAGVPISANLIHGKRDYVPASIFSGCAVLLAAGLFMVSRHMRAKKTGSKWV